MPLIAWDGSLALGLDEIDGQHARFVVLVNNLHDAMMAGRGRDTISETLAGLIAYMHEHFEAEERMMLLHRYPEYAQHKAAHETFVAKIVEWQKRHDKGETALMIEVTNELANWLVQHIKEMDRRYAPYLTECYAR